MEKNNLSVCLFVSGQRSKVKGQPLTVNCSRSALWVRGQRSNKHFYCHFENRFQKRFGWVPRYSGAGRAIGGAEVYWMTPTGQKNIDV